MGILMITKSAGEVIHSCVIPKAVFKHSGVVILLDLDPESVVEIHKPDGMSISYEYAK